MIDTQHITGLVLAGGQGSRMGGVDKGLRPHRGVPMALHALRRLRSRVGTVMVSANRHLSDYEAMGAPVWPDALPGHPGPLAGFLAGLEHCATPYMVTVPCDSPLFPRDLVDRLADALEREDADIAVAATLEDGAWRVQPVFCLMKASVIDSLRRFMESGQRQIDAWTALHRRALARFDDAAAFANVNTLDEWRRLEASHG